MKKPFFLFFYFFLITVSTVPKKSEAQLLNGYNQQFYTNVFDAAEGVAMPFLLVQGYKTMPGVTIQNDTTLLYNGQIYTFNNRYQNPENGNPNGYYIELSQYGKYQIDIFRNVWHIQIPRVFYNFSEHSFSSMADCVGYGTRLLSAVGDTTENGNAYLKLINTIKTANRTIIAERGYVASAYEFGAAFPTLPDANPGGWEYISGNIIADSINAYNHRLHPGVGNYNGRVKGGYVNSQIGDILSFAYGPGGESNGHFMVLSDKPYQVNFDTLNHFYPNVPDTAIQNFLNTYNVYATPVYDCSGLEAHFYDSRRFTSGIGHGTLWILTQPGTDIPMGLIFKEPKSSNTEIHAQLLEGSHTWAITVGRYNVDEVGIHNTGSEIPSTATLKQNYPNPFNPDTKIQFHIQEAGFAKLVIYDVTGREVITLVNEELSAGVYEAKWNASSYSSGVYYYNLYAGGYTQTKKMVLTK
jgi:hypothetical protein